MDDRHRRDAPVPEPAPPLFGEPEYRVDGALKVTGTARFAADFSRPGMLWVAFRRSDVPHGRLVSVNTERAKSAPGVHAVLTGADLGGRRFGRRLLDQPILASDVVRFVGERIAAVAAETPEQAEEAAQLIDVAYEELPAVLDPDAALAADAPILHPEAAEYRYLGGERPGRPHPNVQGWRLIQRGDPDLERAFAAAAQVFEDTFTTSRLHHGYIEPHATMVWLDDDQTAHVVSTNKAPFGLRAQMAAALELPEQRLEIDSGFIGGDFGGKGYSPDEYACYFLARATRRPVKAVMSYTDELAAANPSHASIIRLRSAVDEEGRFVAHQARVVFNGGAYAAAKPLPPLLLLGGFHTMAMYRIPNVAVEVMAVYTNLAPGGHMRSPGEVQAVFAGESHVDRIARRLDCDPLDFRLLNALQPGEEGPTGERHREARAAELLKTLRDATGWGSPMPANHGRGVAIGLRHVGTGKTSMRVGFGTDSLVRVETALPDQGGGAQTVVQRVVAGLLSVSPDRVRIVRRSTADGLPDSGVGGSRVTHIASQAASRAARELKARIEARARATLGEGTEEIRLVDDWLVGQGGRNRVRLEEAAPILAGDGELVAEGSFEAGPHEPGEAGDYDFCAYVAEVAVDPETGQLSILRVTLAADVGTIINPVAHRGQLEGGFAFGIGAATMEELVIDSGRVATLNLGDYKLPTSMDVPPLEIILVPTSVGPGAFGAKMAGELANASVAPAVANALADAVGVRLFSLPLNAERIHAALQRRHGYAEGAPAATAEEVR